MSTALIISAISLLMITVLSLWLWKGTDPLVHSRLAALFSALAISSIALSQFWQPPAEANEALDAELKQKQVISIPSLKCDEGNQVASALSQMTHDAFVVGPGEVRVSPSAWNAANEAQRTFVIQLARRVSQCAANYGPIRVTDKYTGQILFQAHE